MDKSIIDIGIYREERQRQKERGGHLAMVGYPPIIKIERAPPPLKPAHYEFAIEHLAKCWANGIKLNDSGRYGYDAKQAMYVMSIDPREIPDHPISIQHHCLIPGFWPKAVGVNLSADQCAAAMRRALEILKEPKSYPVETRCFPQSTPILKKRMSRWTWLKKPWRHDGG